MTWPLSASYLLEHMPTPPDPKQTEMARQIAQAWDLAKGQLQKLREQVEKTAEMAALKSKSDALERERDRALRNFGEAVYREVQKGTLKLPAALSGALRAMMEVERKLEKQASDISDILAEGAEVAERVKKKPPPPGHGPKR